MFRTSYFIFIGRSTYYDNSFLPIVAWDEIHFRVATRDLTRWFRWKHIIGFAFGAQSNMKVDAKTNTGSCKAFGTWNRVDS